MVARTTTTTTSTRGRRPHKARTFLTYSVPGGASRAAESISLRALRVATPRACAPAVDSVAHTPELVAQVFAVLRHDEVQQAKRATRCWLEVSRTTQTAARLLPSLRRRASRACLRRPRPSAMPVAPSGSATTMSPCT